MCEKTKERFIDLKEVECFAVSIRHIGIELSAYLHQPEKILTLNKQHRKGDQDDV